MPYSDITELSELLSVINTTNPAIIYYGADWCGSCKDGSTIFNTVADLDENDGVSFFKVNISNIPEAQESQNISSIPLIIAYVNGQEYRRFVGVATNKLINLIDKCLAKVAKDQAKAGTGES